MCGIVGVASNGPMSHQMKEFFQSLLFHDVVRGPHATGVAAIDTLDRSLVVHKKAVPSPAFLSDTESMEGLFATKHNFNIYIGHNRYATRGAKDKDENAHPFIHGDIVGVHNGSLNNQTLLDKHIDFEVDSDNLYHHMNAKGLDDTLKNTDGAFALVWYDRKDNTLNFIRNEERPLAIGKLSNGTWVWASEMAMLKWLVSRHKTLSWATYEENGVKYNHVFNLEKSTHLKVEFKDKSRNYETPRATPKTLPVFPTPNYYGSGYQGGFRSWGYDDRDDNRGNRSTRPPVERKTPYEKDVQARLDTFIIGGTVGSSVIEVEFMGHAKERTSGGYEANLSLFKYQSKNGKVVICHAFNHNACLTRDWTEADIGTRLFGTISTCPAIGMGSYECTKNEELGFCMSLTALTTIKPNKYYPFSDKKEGESQNVLPFRVPQQTGTTTGEKGSEGSQLSGSEQAPVLTIEEATALVQELLDKYTAESGTQVEGVEKGKEVRVLGVTERVLTLANATCTQEEFQDLVNESGGHCSNCCTRMGNIGVSKLHLYEHFDRAVGNTQYFLSCSSKCHKLTIEIMEELDRDYDKFYGGNDA